MVYAVILAGGLSDKLHRIDAPRPFLMLGSKPIIIHTIEQFMVNPHINKIIVAVSEEWSVHTQSTLFKWLPDGVETPIVSGGVNKTATLKKVTEYIHTNYGIRSDDMIIAHDAIRPFITQRIIDDNINAIKSHMAAITVMDTSDTIIRSVDRKFIDDVPLKPSMFAEQTPLTFNGEMLKVIFDSFDDEYVNNESEIARLFINKGIDLYMVAGEYSNMKLISQFDIEVANSLLKRTRYD